MVDVKWIKIVTDIFDDEKILLIESMPDRDSIIVIWFKLLCLAGKTNNGGVLLLNNCIPYTDEMLATIFRRPVNTVRFALKTFEKFGMVEIVNNTITIPNWGKHQNTDALENKRNYMKGYMQEYRQKQRKIACKTNCKTNCETNVSQTDIDIEKELDKENIHTAEKPQRYTEEIAEIVSYLNEKAGTKYRAKTDATKRHIIARLNDGFSVDDFKEVIDKKCDDWMGTDYQKYLRPETLFGNKFEGYLNGKKSSSGGEWDIIEKDGKSYDRFGNEYL